MTKYNSGFGNHFATEALAGALPEGRNSPQKVKYGLYAEQLTGSAFTMPRAQNFHSWLYRIRPSVMQTPFRPYEGNKHIKSTPFDDQHLTPSQLRWSPVAIPTGETDFIDGIITMAGGGDSKSWNGLGVHLYAANSDMTDRYFYNADGEMLIVPQKAGLS